MVGHMAYVSTELLTQAAKGLHGSHPLAVVTIPALLHATREQGATQPTFVEFGSTPETAILETAFRLRDGDKPYAAVWANPISFVNSDYAGSTLQRQRTRDANYAGPVIRSEARGGTKRTHFSLTPDAGVKLLAAGGHPIKKVDLAIWLGRHENITSIGDLMSWFAAEYPFGNVALSDLYIDTDLGAYEALPLGSEEADSEAIAAALGLNLEYPVDRRDDEPVEYIIERRELGEPEPEKSFEWTSDLCGVPLSVADVTDLTSRIVKEIHLKGLAFTEPERLARRCVTSLLTGHLILTGPPGTGKTTLARIIANVFNVALRTSTATPEWTPYHVVGGLRPSATGTGFVAHHGYVSATVLDCAEVTRKHRDAEPEAQAQLKQGTWLLIDEFNRADIDQAIGSLYTVLAAVTTADRRSSPIDLWYEQDAPRQRVWVPGTFRIIAAMNDVDTNFVNAMSQGLTRRFSRVPVLPPSKGQVAAEVAATFEQAHRWFADAYADVLPIEAVQSLEAMRAQHEQSLQLLARAIEALRYPEGHDGWPLGSAQVLDVLRGVMVNWHGSESDDLMVLDEVLADRLIPQMGSLEDSQLDFYRESLATLGLSATAAAVAHLQNPNQFG